MLVALEKEVAIEITRDVLHLAKMPPVIPCSCSFLMKLSLLFGTEGPHNQVFKTRRVTQIKPASYNRRFCKFRSTQPIRNMLRSMTYTVEVNLLNLKGTGGGERQVF